MVRVNDWAKGPTQVTMYIREPVNAPKANASIVVLVREPPDRFGIVDADGMIDPRLSRFCSDILGQHERFSFLGRPEGYISDISRYVV